MSIFKPLKGGWNEPLPPSNHKTLFEMAKIKKSNPDSKRIGVKKKYRHNQLYFNILQILS